MNELALFAGAGGGILGGHLLGWRTICAVEQNEYAASVLMQRQNDGILPAFPVWDDVCTFDGRPWKGRVDVVSGGFPCQAFSSAASGRNCADDLWPEMRRIVADVNPRLVYAENVSAKAINAASDDLEEMGYKTKAIKLGAHDVGADHVRNRFWLLAYANNQSELLRKLYAEMAERKKLQSAFWEGSPMAARISDGVAGRVDRFTATGNGQVPAVAAKAFLELVKSI